MTAWLPWLVVMLPVTATVALGFMRGTARGWGVVVATTALLGAALALVWHPMGDAWLRVDQLAAHMAVLVAGAGVLAAWQGRAGGGGALLLGVVGALALAVLAGDAMLAWAGLAAAVLALLLGGQASAAAWRGLMAMAVALLLVLLGTVVLAGGPGRASLGFILVVSGLAAVAGLAPLHGWMVAPGRGAARVLVPVVGAVALVALMRARDLVLAQAGTGAGAVDPRPVLLALGLASLAWAALGFWRGRAEGAAWLFPAGLAAVAFGVGGAADAAGLVLLSAGVLAGPLVAGGGRGRAIGLAVLALLPPFAPFGAALVLLRAAMDAELWLAVVLGVLMAAGAAGLARAAAVAWTGGRQAWADEAPGLAVALVLLAAGVVPFAGRWFVEAVR